MKRSFLDYMPQFYEKVKDYNGTYFEIVGKDIILIGNYKNNVFLEGKFDEFDKVKVNKLNSNESIIVTKLIINEIISFEGVVDFDGVSLKRNIEGQESWISIVLLPMFDDKPDEFFVDQVFNHEINHCRVHYLVSGDDPDFNSFKEELLVDLLYFNEIDDNDVSSKKVDLKLSNLRKVLRKDTLDVYYREYLLIIEKLLEGKSLVEIIDLSGKCIDFILSHKNSGNIDELKKELVLLLK